MGGTKMRIEKNAFGHKIITGKLNFPKAPKAKKVEGF
jgi:hypothetical protein